MKKRWYILVLISLVLIILAILLTKSLAELEMAQAFDEKSIYLSAVVGFLFLCGFILCWVGLSIGCGTFASNRGRSFLGFFIFSLLISPLIGFIVAFISTGKSEINKCPDCAEFIKSEANVCKHCGKRFDLKEVENKTID